MEQILHNMALIIVLAPLMGSLVVGLAGKQVGRAGAHWITIIGVGIAFIGSLYVFTTVVLRGVPVYNGTLYTWGDSGSVHFTVGFLVDRLSSVMMVIVTFVSLLVHIYTIGYMKNDLGYQRFFSYMSLFTFSMLTLVLANNFMLMFFGWEAVGLVSYLLIGFWFEKESAVLGGFKAFIANRVGDFGFLLGIAAILNYFGTLDYAQVFEKAPSLLQANMSILPHSQWSVMTVICILLFVGAMGKSAQMPLHVWLPESMEGPTPISALIHAATMVTAGVYMVARMSPLYELAPTAQSVVVVIGATGALLMGMLAVVQFDIKRVIAYSTMSQLGYMMVANGVSAFSVAIFHLATHACFKALLFLAAGSVIIGMHHEQDMRKMGNLRKHMPITYVTFLIGGLSMCAIPPLAGFYSKDAIIEATKISSIPGAHYAYLCVLIGAFVTALYTFRALFLTFHTQERMDKEVKTHLKESPAVVWIPLVLLAIPSVILGFSAVKPMIYSGASGFLGSSIYVAPQYSVLKDMGEHYMGAFSAIFEAFLGLPFWVTVAGIFVAWLCYIKFPALPDIVSERLSLVYRILTNKYGFDQFNAWLFGKWGTKLAEFFYRFADTRVIDNLLVNGSGRRIDSLSRVLRQMQSGYLYHYAFAMILGLLGFLCWFLLR